MHRDMKRIVLASLVLVSALGLTSATELLAQRRSTSGGGSSTRGTPSGSSGRATSGGSSTRSSGGSATRSGGTASSAGSSTRTASSADRPASGKIDGVRRTARTARGTPTGEVVIIDRGVYLGGCWDCSYWGWYRGRYGWYHGGWWYPERRDYGREREEEVEGNPGQGYLPYPYAEHDGTGATFVEQRATRRNSYGTVSGQYFSDVGSTTVAGRFAVEGAFRALRVEAEFGRYAEPLASGTDHFNTFRLGVGFQPRLGNNGYVVAGVGARTVALDGGLEAGGIEGQLGVQLLPLRPFGVSVSGRLAAMQWEGERNTFTLREMNSMASLFVGRIEIQGGWHWLKLGDAAAFGGPILGTRIWF